LFIHSARDLIIDMPELPNIQIRNAEFPADKQVVGQLFRAYAQSLPISLDFQNFDHELAELPGKYATEKGGAVWLLVSSAENIEASEKSTGFSTTRDNEQAIGCIAIRPFFATPTTAESATLLAHSTAPPTKTCELKRLFLAPETRGLGLSKPLMEVALSHAEKLGYEEMLLDTLRSMKTARRLYEGYGFEEIDSYYENPEDAVFYRLKL
jgi:ribosomal protein S18 acetylase RimI-like enzyme